MKASNFERLETMDNDGFNESDWKQWTTMDLTSS